jgi:hypothetical protein
MAGTCAVAPLLVLQRAATKHLCLPRFLEEADQGSAADDAHRSKISLLPLQSGEGYDRSTIITRLDGIQQIIDAVEFAYCGTTPALRVLQSDRAGHRVSVSGLGGGR